VIFLCSPTDFCGKIGYLSPVQPDIKYWKKLAAFAYASYLEKSFGAVLIKQDTSQPFSAATLDKHLQYIPFDPDKDDIPLDAVEMITEYDPEKELVLMITDSKGQTICLQLSAEKLGITPLEAYKEIRGKFVPGQVYQLKEKIENISTGYYIFNGEEKTLLVFARAGMEEDEGDLCRTDEIIKVHCDFRDYFLPTEMKIRAE